MTLVKEIDKMNIPNNMPMLGCNFKIEKLNVVGSVITISRRLGKIMLVQDESCNDINCDFKCGKSICDGSCVKNITLANKTSGTVIIMYIC